MMESDQNCDIGKRKKRIWRALGLRFKNINFVLIHNRMLSQHVRPLVKSMVKWNIWNESILTRVFAKLENSRSSQWSQSILFHFSRKIVFKKCKIPNMTCLIYFLKNLDEKDGAAHVSISISAQAKRWCISIEIHRKDIVWRRVDLRDILENPK